MGYKNLDSATVIRIIKADCEVKATPEMRRYLYEVLALADKRAGDVAAQVAALKAERLAKEVTV